MCDAVDISKATDGLTYEEKLLVLQLMRELKAAKGEPNERTQPL